MVRLASGAAAMRFNGRPLRLRRLRSPPQGFDRGRRQRLRTAGKGWPGKGAGGERVPPERVPGELRRSAPLSPSDGHLAADFQLGRAAFRKGRAGEEAPERLSLRGTEIA